MSKDQKRPVGLHVSISGHLKDAVGRAVEVGCVKTFQIFSCSPRRWNASPIDDFEAEAFKRESRSRSFDPFSHMPYLPNLCSPDAKFYSQSVDVLIREIQRCDKLGINSLVVHFGSHLGTSVEDGHSRLIKACKRAISETPGSSVQILLENSAGVRNSVGSNFRQIKHVLDEIAEKRMGVCFDTCHAFASGYDLRSEVAMKKTMEEFDVIIGRDFLKLIHLNDSKGDLGSAKDRHENIGEGKIGLEGFRALLGLKSFSQIPVILETPIEKVGDDRKNLDLTKSLLAK